MNKTTTIYGPPGTGKTTRLLSIVESFISKGTKPEDIAYLAFTKKAADEARDRACEKFSLSPLDFRYFRTLHSLAFRELRLERADVVTYGDLIQLSRITGYDFSNHKVTEDGQFSSMATKGDRLLFLENLSRATCRSLNDTHRRYADDEVALGELEYFTGVYTQYKKTNCKIDFTDMLSRFVDNIEMKRFRVLIVDEGQDLSRLQWQLVYKLAVNSDNVFVAGDDDQAIYNWAGAEVEEFLSLKGDSEVLTQSYRIPSKVHNVAVSISSRIKNRKAKSYLPKEEEGVVEFPSDVDNLDLSKGNWLLLARNVYLLEKFTLHCLERGYLFSSRLKTPIREPVLRAIKFWEMLRNGSYVRAEEVKNIYDYMSVKTRVKFGSKKALKALPDEKGLSLNDLRRDYGLVVDTLWRHALDRITGAEEDYVVMALKRGEKMLGEPRIRINTIHGVKGGEADNVAILTDMSYRTHLESEKDPDSEHRVWYVAVTRAKQNLFLIAPNGRYFYQF
jgi:DNA helicase-2/ATP-dependent DNA helicase PcrA